MPQSVYTAAEVIALLSNYYTKSEVNAAIVAALTPAPPRPSPPGSTPLAPSGPSGTWRLAFEDVFSGTTLDATKWEPYWLSAEPNLNNVPAPAVNVVVADGNLALTLASPSSGACITTRNKFTLRRESVFEARIFFPGDGASIYNWPGFWVLHDDPGAPSVEMAIAEAWDGVMQAHYQCGASNPSYIIPGYWGGWHVYTCHRRPTSWDIYIDGVLRKIIPKDTADDGQAQYILLHVEKTFSGNHTVYGAGSTVLVDYVRAWKPAA